MLLNFTDMQIVDGIADAFFILDAAWCFTVLNRAAEQFWGLPRQQLLGRCIWEAFPHLGNSNFEQDLRQAHQQQIQTRLETYLSITQTWYEVQLTPYDSGLAVCLQDISVRRQTEAALLERSHLATLEARVSHVLVQVSSASAGLQRCGQLLTRELHAAATAIWLHDTQTLQLEVAALAPQLAADSVALQAIPRNDLLIRSTLSPEEPILHRTVCLHQSYCQPLTTANRDPLAAADREAASFYCDLNLSQLDVAGFWLATYPLLLEARLVGVLGVWHAVEPSAAANETLAAIADTLAIAIDRTWARAALSSRREALLFRLANQIRNSLDLDTILGTAVREIRNLLQVDWCSYLWCWQQGAQYQLTVSHQAGDDSLQTPDLESYPETQLARLTDSIVKQQPLRISDFSTANLGIGDRGTAARAWRDLLVELDIQALLVLPLKTRSNQLGAIFCANRRSSQHWNERDLELLQAVVDQLAFAIDQAELFAQTRATALAAQTQAQQLQLTLEELKRTQSQLIQTEKMSSLGQMIAGIAHEINNPVNFISGNLSYVGEYIDDVLRLIQLYQTSPLEATPEIRELTAEIDLEFILEDLPKTLASMQIGTDRIRQIVLSLRNFSRLDQAEMKPVDVHEGIDSTLLILHNRLKAKANQPEVSIQKDYRQLPLVECYAGQLNQVFMNIISNAADALESQPEPRRITIATEFTADSEPLRNALERGTVKIRIRDNGPGMDAATIERIFDPFYTTKPVGKGTGLGLSISYQIIVEKHRGRLECHSQLGEGTEFIIAIPTAVRP